MSHCHVIWLLLSHNSCGGQWLITDVRRGETMYDIDPSLRDRVDDGIDNDGSNLSGVTSRCGWEELPYASASDGGGYADDEASLRHNEHDDDAGDGQDVTQNGTCHKTHVRLCQMLYCVMAVD